MINQPTCARGAIRARRTVGSLALLLALPLADCTSGTEPVLTLWEGTLAPSVAGGITGTVAAVTQFGRTLVSIEIRQGQEGATYGWRINAGSCQSAGALQGGAAVYAPLVADEAGAATSAEGKLPGLAASPPGPVRDSREASTRLTGPPRCAGEAGGRPKKNRREGRFLSSWLGD